MPESLFPTEGDPADFVILHGAESLQSAVLYPSFDRTTIHSGVVVARRWTHSWLLGGTSIGTFRHSGGIGLPTIEGA